MVDLENREDRNKLRGVVISAEKNEIITKEEAGFIITLIERFRADIVKKEKQMLILQGELGQLRSNEQIIVQLIEGLVSAAERDIARRETAQKLREGHELRDERRAAIRERLVESLDEEESVPEQPSNQ
jgi:hypothetical protein